MGKGFDPAAMCKSLKVGKNGGSGFEKAVLFSFRRPYFEDNVSFFISVGRIFFDFGSGIEIVSVAEAGSFAGAALYLNVKPHEFVFLNDVRCGGNPCFSGFYLFGNGYQHNLSSG